MVGFADVVENSTRVSRDPEADGFERYVLGKDIPADGRRVGSWGEVGDGHFGSRIRTIIEEDDVICTTRGPNLRVARSSFRCLGAHTNFVLRTKSSEVLLQDYLALVVASQAFQDHLRQHFRGSVNLFVNWSDAAEFRLALPPTPEQHRIVEVIAATDKVDHLYGAVGSASSALARAEAGAFLGHDRETARLGEIADVVGGVTKDSGRSVSADARSVPYLRVANVLRGAIDLDDLAFITVEPKVIERLRLQRGDVLLNEGGDRDQLGRGWVWDGDVEDCIHQNHVFRARVHDSRFSSQFVAWMANFGNPRWFEANGRQTTNLASISLTKVKEFPLPVLDEGERNRLDGVLRKDLELRRRLEEARLSATSVRSGLVRDLLAGAAR
jgi:hypothetical protein